MKVFEIAMVRVSIGFSFEAVRICGFKEENRHYL